VRRATQRALPSRLYSGTGFDWLCQARSKRITCLNFVNVHVASHGEAYANAKAECRLLTCSRGLLAAIWQLRGEPRYEDESEDHLRQLVKAVVELQALGRASCFATVIFLAGTNCSGPSEPILGYRSQLCCSSNSASLDCVDNVPKSTSRQGRRR
jgi:hypothetical protein